MPRNPLISTRMNTGKQPQDRPQAIPPVPEEYVGDNNPYRGTESHGVARTVEPTPIEGYGATQPGVTYVKPEKDEEPVPVRIVQSFGREIKDWRAHTGSVGTQGITILGRNEARSSVLVQNQDAANSLYIAANPIDSVNCDILGFELKPGQSVTINSENEVYAVAKVAGPSKWQAIEHYSVEL